MPNATYPKDPWGRPLPLNPLPGGPLFVGPDGKLRYFAIPPLPVMPAPRPGLAYPNPAFLILPPHGPPPFPVKPFEIPKVYKGIPNQPFGLLPPLGIPFWVRLNPITYLIIPRIPPVAPPGAKYIIYFYYPLPFRGTVSGRILVVPQYILVPIDYVVPTVRPSSIPILIVPPKRQMIPSELRPQGRPALVMYMMPVLDRPVDPSLKPLFKRYND